MWSTLENGDSAPVYHMPAPAIEGQSEADKIELLSAMDIFHDLSEAEMISLVDDVPPLHNVPKGTLLYGADGPEVLFLLKSGRVELFRPAIDGKKLTLAYVEQGTFFGEMSLIGQRLVGTCAAAVADSVICALTREDVESVILKHPTVGLRVIEVLANRLQHTRVSLQEMAFNDLTGRVAGLLLRLADDADIVEGYSHQDLASMVGCLRESFTASLDKFKESDAVGIGRKRIEIIDRGQLQDVVNQRTGVPGLT